MVLYLNYPADYNDYNEDKKILSEEQISNKEYICPVWNRKDLC
jgi:hypothetical protein